jgi:hypothetical protein
MEPARSRSGRVIKRRACDDDKNPKPASRKVSAQGCDSQTYLRYFCKGQKTPHHILSLQQYRAELDPKQKDGSNDGDDGKDGASSYCQMVYSFVMGSGEQSK